MAEAQLQQFLAKVKALNAFVACTEADPRLRQALADCNTHVEVVELARSLGFEIGRRWGEGETADALPPAGGEVITVLLQTPQWRLERIHSNQASAPAEGWYDQQEQEWVLLLQGSALVQFEGEDEPRALAQGEHLMIPAGRRHRVVRTDPDPGTVWLALFWSVGAEH